MERRYKMAKQEEKKNPSLFQKLTKLFRSGPVVRRKIRNLDTTVAVADRSKSSGALLFQKSMAPTYATITANAYNLSERLMRYQDFQEMEYTPELAAAMDIYADETVAQDDKGRVLHIYSDNEKIKEILEDLFYNTLNVEFNLRSWARNLVKYGDMFLYNDVSPDAGVINAFPIPVNEIEREENYDPNDPMAVRYRWVTLGNRTLENWEVTHFRLLGNDMFLPYGSSVIEPARRIWRQLILIEDAMLVYRVVRAPERRVFYIDVANIPPENVPMYVEEQRKNLRSSQVIDRNTGRVDLRYNPLPVHKDTPVPLLDGTTLTIENISKKMKENPGWTPWVYSVQDGTKRIVPGKVVWCGKNYVANKLTKVWLDDGSYIVTAPEHPYVMRDGGRKRADELKPGDSLMSAYRDLNNRGYERIVEPSGIRNSTHVIVARDAHNEKWDSTPLRVVHHSHPECGTSNKRDNRPENLTVMNFWEHRKLHAEHCELTLNRPEQLAERRIKRIAFNKSLDKRRRTSELNRTLGKAKKMSGAYNGSELHASHNEIRRTAQLDSWSKDRVSRSEKMQWIIPNDVVSFVFGVVKSNKKIGREELTSAVRNDTTVMESLRSANAVNERNVDKFHVTAIVSKLHRMGCISRSTYRDFRKFAAENEAPVNHQVVAIETILDASDDVYCMTVVGPRGEDDRHNFAVNGLSQQTDSKSLKSLIFVWNSVDEDYFIPVRGGESGTKIDTLAGGQNAAAVEDVAYIQKKMFAALKIPRAYLGYDEALSSKATLAQEDIRFSRTINVIQKTLISELNKLAIIHLYANGFDSEDLQNFTLRLSNPSTVAQQQKLELWRSKFEIAGSAPEGQMSKEFIRKEIWGLNDEQCKTIDEQRLKEKIVDQTIENAKPDESEGGDEGGGDAGGGEDLFGGGEEGGEEGGGEESGGEEESGGGEDLFAGDDVRDTTDVGLLTAGDDAADDDELPLKFSLDSVEVPIKAQRQLDRALYNRSRIRHSGPAKTHMPDFKRMTKSDNKDPYDASWITSYVRNPFGESNERTHYRTTINSDVASTLRNMALSSKFSGPTTKQNPQQVLSENLEPEPDATEYREVLVIDDEE